MTKYSIFSILQRNEAGSPGKCQALFLIEEGVQVQVQEHPLPVDLALASWV
jgi:hypothetical protein